MRRREPEIEQMERTLATMAYGVQYSGTRREVFDDIVRDLAEKAWKLAAEELRLVQQAKN